MVTTVAGRQKSLYAQLASYYINSSGLSKDEAVSRVHKSLTFKWLMDAETEFHAKSIQELIYLLNLEFAGEMEKWYHQAI